MKKQLAILFVLTLTISTNAQLSAVKVGGSLNADIVYHKLGKINYPSWEISFERALGKKFSINGTLNYAQRDYHAANEYELLSYPGTFSGAIGYTIYDKTLILEGRYYLKSNTEGFYFQLGIPLTYSTEKRFYASALGEGSVENYSYAISTFGGFGIKYSLSSSFGIEMNMDINPSLNFLDADYGTSGFIKSGVKLFFSIDKVKTMNLKK